MSTAWDEIKNQRREARQIEVQCWCGKTVVREASELDRTAYSAYCRAHSRKKREKER